VIWIPQRYQSLALSILPFRVKILCLLLVPVLDSFTIARGLMVTTRGQNPPYPPSLDISGGMG